MKKSKSYKIIKFLIVALPLLCILLQCFRLGTYNLVDIEQLFSVYRTFDFGLSQNMIHNCFNDSTNTLLLLTFDLGEYLLFSRLVLFVIDLFGMMLLIGERLLDKLVRGLD